MTSVEIRTRGMLDSLTPSERKAAEYFISDANSVFRMPIARLAEASGASQVAWVRLCKTLGFSGLKELKREVIAELGAAEQADEPVSAAIASGGDSHALIEMVCAGAVRTVDETKRLLDERALTAAAELILNANSIKLFGVGASALVAEDFFNRLLRCGYDAVFCRDNHLQLMYASNLCERDVGVFISHSGNTREVVETLRMARSRGAKTIAITKYGRSPLVMESDRALFTASPEMRGQSASMGSRMAQLLVVDMLYTVLASMDYQRVKPMIENSRNSVRSHKLSI